MINAIDPDGSNIVIKDSNENCYVLIRIKHKSALSTIPDIEADVRCADVDASYWLGEKVICEVFNGLDSNREAIRSFKGFVVSVKSIPSAESEQYSIFRLHIQPWLGLLKYNRRNRVFQNVKTIDVVKYVTGDTSLNVKFNVESSSGHLRDQCIQFNETDLNFISRLLAQEGYHYYFDTDSESDKVIIHDAGNPFSSEKMVYLDDINSPSGKYEVIGGWSIGYKFKSSGLSLKGYDEIQAVPVSFGDVKSKYKISSNHNLEEHIYPEFGIKGDMTDTRHGLAAIRKSQIDSDYCLFDAVTNSTELAVGRYFKLESHHDKDQAGEYLVISIEQEFFMDDERAFAHSCSFTCVKKEHAYYPAKLEKPKIYGMQSAVVEERKPSSPNPIADDKGRIHIRFHWEDDDKKSNCWVRVAQSMAGNGYGLQFIPRPGQEVLVSFLNGDPDHPVVTGSLYNHQNNPPYPTENTCQSGIRTKLQGPSNELCFDDKDGNEKLYVHAARDFMIEVENDADEKVMAEKRVTVTKDIQVDTDSNYSLSAGKNIKLEAMDSLELVVGNSKLKMSPGKIELSGLSIDITGKSNLNLKAGAQLTLKSDGVLEGSGTNTTIKATAVANLKGAAMTEVSSSGVTTVKGSMVMVN